MSEKKKPVRLRIETQLLSAQVDSSEAVLVSVSSAARQEKNKKASTVSTGGRQMPSQISSQTKKKSLPAGPGFDFRGRFEKKGRGGQPVYVLYAFSYEKLQTKGITDLKHLAKVLKEKLSCGGSVHEDPEEELILQFRDRERLETVLQKLGLRMQLSGGQ